MTEITFLVCTNRRYSEQNPSCAARDSEAVVAQLKQRGMKVQESCCFGRCAKGAVLKVLPTGDFYYGVTENDIPVIIEEVQKREHETQSLE